MTYFQKTLASPVGPLRCVATEEALVGVFSESQIAHVDRVVDVDEHSAIDCAITQLEAYFDGTETDFSIPMQLVGTDFQRAVWNELLKIPYGETRSYSQIADALGKPKAVRAVGAANGKNPLGIVVPCHRVIGSNGKLTGYAGGLDMKLWLLRHEGALLL